ncbi:hypothetical protein [Solitalea canadensis]|uniref:Uncharacterized protein n=1 Tax=Solitalea canadensis (strain ATCC 29591 / DSM 3403 / JCM 21819 / LMG 8368 / NBRC 15130 / NCIMB 12057 / USAM 9D) TaxID=929556 RepID=H8KPZ4_SOLCM|nr:hypothetical protein [Solitalea canadensis]AFD06103.1 hypothetical protein Solca_0993 [Solitalea canadensis DSM 3403]
MTESELVLGIGIQAALPQPDQNSKGKDMVKNQIVRRKISQIQFSIM